MTRAITWVLLLALAGGIAYATKRILSIDDGSGGGPAVIRVLGTTRDTLAQSRRQDRVQQPRALAGVERVVKPEQRRQHIPARLVATFI